MNFYPFHLGDYAAHTKHLTLLEDLAYRRMIDLYYTNESQLPLDPEKVARLIGMRDHMREVSDVLSDFFVKSENGYSNSRCDKEIAAYKAKADRAKSANKSRWSAEKSDSPMKSDQISDVKSDADRIPTNNQEPITNKELPHTPQAGQKSRKAVSLQTYLDNCKQAGKKPIDEKHAVFEYADKTGIPHDFLRLQWLEFKARYTMPEAKRYKAWQTVFLKSVRGNWFRLWYSTDGTYALTTTGQQAKAAHREAA